MKDDFGGCGDCSSHSLEVYDGFRCLFGEGNDVCGDEYDDVTDGCGDLGHDSSVGCDGLKLLYDSDSFDDVNNGVEKVENDVAVKDDGCSDAKDGGLVGCDGFLLLYGDDNDVQGDNPDDDKESCEACAVENDVDIKDDGCSDSEDGGLVGCDGFILLYGDDKDVQGDSFDNDRKSCEVVQNDVDFKGDSRVNLDDDGFVGFDGFDYLYDNDNEVCGDGFEDVKNSLETENHFDVNDSFEDRGDFVGDNVDRFDSFRCFSGEEDDVCNDGVDLSDVQHSSEVKNDFDFDELEKKKEARDISKGGDCGPVSKEVKEKEHYDMHKVITENTTKGEGKPKKQKVKKRKNVFTGWICSKILKVFVKNKVLL